MKKNKATITSKIGVLLVLVMVASLSLGVYMYKGIEVSLELDGEELTIVSNAETVEEFIQREDIRFKRGAYINVPLETRLDEKPNIIIKNMKTFTIDDNGKIKKVRSIHTTVEEVLKDIKVEMGPSDYTYPELGRKVLHGDTIKLFRFREETIIEEVVVPYESMVSLSRDLDINTIKVVQEGNDGLKKTHTRKIYVNDELIVTKVVEEEILIPVSDYIVEKGLRDTMGTSRGDARFTKSLTMSATSYDLSFASTGKRPGDKYYGITASGTQAGPGVVAVDPRVIPLGTKLYVESLDETPDYGFCTAEDTGGAIKGERIDLFYHSPEVVRKFGRRNVKVYILEDQ